MVTAIARTIPKTNKSLSGAGFGAMSPLLAPDRCRHADFRRAKRKRYVSYVTLRWLSKKCTCASSATHSGLRVASTPRRTDCDFCAVVRAVIRCLEGSLSVFVGRHGAMNPAGKEKHVD